MHNSQHSNHSFPGPSTQLFATSMKRGLFGGVSFIKAILRLIKPPGCTHIATTYTVAANASNRLYTRYRKLYSFVQLMLISNYCILCILNTSVLPICSLFASTYPDSIRYTKVNIETPGHNSNYSELT